MRGRGWRVVGNSGGLMSVFRIKRLKGGGRGLNISFWGEKK